MIILVVDVVIIVKFALIKILVLLAMNTTIWMEVYVNHATIGVQIAYMKTFVLLATQDIIGHHILAKVV